MTTEKTCEKCGCRISIEDAVECFACHRVLCAEHCRPTGDGEEAVCEDCAGDTGHENLFE